LVIFNANQKTINYDLIKTYHIAVLGDEFYTQAIMPISKNLKVPAISMAILFKE
jgi:hypothetical protein